MGTTTCTTTGTDTRTTGTDTRTTGTDTPTTGSDTPTTLSPAADRDTDRAGDRTADRFAGRRLRAIPGDQPADAELVSLAVDGDREAFGELYRRHHRGVLAAIGDRTRDPQRRSELAHDSFLRAMQQLHRLRDRDRFRPWLLQIARNTAIDDARRRSRRPTESLDLVPEPASDDEPALVVEIELLAASIARSVAGLAPREATALTLAVAGGYDQVALGAALGITPGHARVVLHRARRHLRIALERGGSERPSMLLGAAG